jgi:hypothetical protein
LKATIVRILVTQENQEGACADRGEDLGTEVRGKGLEVERQLFPTSTEQYEGKTVLTL